MVAERCDAEDSPFERLDPRTRLLAATGAAFCFSCIRNTTLSWICLAVALFLVTARKPSAMPLLKRLALANLFIAFIWLTAPLTMPGESAASLGPVSWSREGVRLATSVTIKCNAILLAFWALVDGLGLPLIGSALERLRVPPKLIFLFLFTYRHIYSIGEEWRRLQTAARLRGFIPQNSWHTYRTFGNMLGLTFINAVDSSRRIYEATLLRGFNGTFHTVVEMKSTRMDKIFALLFFTLLACLLVMDICLT